jgi:cadmium resistance protein CadD (predicted permease)
MNKETKHKLESFSHLIVGILLLSKGYDKISHHYPVIGALMILFGLLIVIYFFYQLKNRHHHKSLNITVHFLEGISLLLTAYVFYQSSKKYLPYAVGVAGLLYLFAAIRMLIKKNKEKELQTGKTV